jgi:glycosyltransferase involved in cell wall biosynthesis
VNELQVETAKIAPARRADTRHLPVSVVIPARNEETYLPDTLASVAGQRYPNDFLEVVVVDNGSTDRTVTVTERFARDHPRLTVRVVREPIPGVSRAKNRGAEAARGDVLIFLDADSRMDPTLIADVAACRLAGDPAASIRVLADSAHPVDRGFFALMELGKVLFGIRSQMMFCDRRLFIELGGFDPRLRLAEDLEFIRRVQRHLRESGTGTVRHIRTSAIRTSPRRLRALPFHAAVFPIFARWVLAYFGLGRTQRY